MVGYCVPQPYWTEIFTTISRLSRKNSRSQKIQKKSRNDAAVSEQMSRNVVHNILLIDYVTYVHEIIYLLMFLYLSENYSTSSANLFFILEMKAFLIDAFVNLRVQTYLIIIISDTCIIYSHTYIYMYLYTI